jgi:hypothetical protein
VFLAFLRLALPELRDLRLQCHGRCQKRYLSPVWLAQKRGSSEDPIMISIARLVVIASAMVSAGAGPASAWWRYAEWGMTEGQLTAAGRGEAVPCREGVPVCAKTATGSTPRLFVESVEMVGLAASTSFVFDADGKLSQTIVLFPNVDFALVSNALNGVHGKPADDRPGASAVRVWRDERRGSIITATSAGTGAMLSYQPMNRKD